MRPGILARVLALLLVIPTAGCFQQAGSPPQELEVNLLPARRSERNLSRGPALDITPLPMTVRAPTPLQGAAPEPSAAPVGGPAFITPGGPEVPAMEAGEGAGFTTFSLPTPTLTPPPPGPDEVSPECVHTVLGGDTVFDIALRYGSTVADMRAANPSLKGDSPVIRPGQRLVIASCPELQKEATPVVIVPVTPTPAIIATSLPPGFRLHRVRSGDTLYSIALTYGLGTQDLIDANNLLDPDRLDVGQLLLIPPRG